MIHYKEKGPIPEAAPCGVVDGDTPAAWLLWSHDEDSVTCPKCKEIIKHHCFGCPDHGTDECLECMDI